MTLEKTDLLLVSRDGNSFQMAEDEIKTNLADTDLLWVQRDGVDYSIQGVEIKNSGAGGDVEPDPATQVEVPGSLGGTGTESDPFIIPASAAFPYGGVAESSTIITFKNLEWQQVIEFEDENRGANGNERFVQPLGVVNQSGTYSTKLFYSDDPVSTEDKSFTALLTVGDTVFFRWDVVQTDTLPPVISSVTLSEVSLPTTSFDNANILVDVDYTEVGKPEATEALSLSAETRAVSRANSSDIVSSNFVSVTEVEVGFINNSVSIAAKDINWGSSFSSKITVDVTANTDAFTTDTTPIFWTGFKSTNGEKFCPLVREVSTEWINKNAYIYWFSSDTGLPNSWTYWGECYNYNEDANGVASRYRNSHPVGAARYWICFASTHRTIENDGVPLLQYIPYSTREDWIANFFGGWGEDWGLRVIEVENDSELSQFTPGNYVLHTDSEYVDVAKVGNFNDYRFNSYYIPLDPSETYPPFITEDMMLTDYQQIYWKYLDFFSCFGFADQLIDNGAFPGILIETDTIASPLNYNNALILDVGIVTVEGTIIINSNCNVTTSIDGQGWTPVVVTNNLPVFESGREFTVPLGTRWIAIVSPPGGNSSTGNKFSLNHAGAAEFQLRRRSNAGQVVYTDKINKTIYLSLATGDFAVGKQLWNCQVNVTEEVLNTIYAELDADGNVLNLLPFEQEPVVQNQRNQTIKFPSAFASGITPTELLPYGSSVKALVTAKNVAGTAELASQEYFPPTSTFNFSFNCNNFGTDPNFTFIGNPVDMVPTDDDYVFFVWAGGATTGGKCTKQYWTNANWFNGIAGGAGAFGDDGDKNPGNNGAPPRAGVYLTKRRPVQLKVETTDGDGAILTYSISQYGLGLNTQNINQNKKFTGGTGTEAQFRVVREADQTTGVSQISFAGTGYLVGDVLTWKEGFGMGGLTQMDDVYDQLLYGISGGGPVVGTGKGAQSINGGEAPNRTTTTIYPSDGGTGVRYSCDYCNGGDGGSAGWGGAPNASGSGGWEGRHGNDAWMGWSGPNGNIVSGTVSANRPTQGFDFLINGALIVNIVKNQTITVIKLIADGFNSPVITTDYSVVEETNDQ